MATEEECRIVVERTNGADGVITCKYKTIELENIVASRAAKPDIDYEHIEGELTFGH